MLELLRRRRAAAAAVTSLTAQTPATAFAASITCPAGVIAGDVIVLLQFFDDSGSLPANAVPSGFTTISTLTNSVTRRCTLSYKKAVGGEASSSLTGITGTGNSQYALYYFRPNTAPTTVTVVSNNSQYINTGAPTNQTIASSAHTPPLIAVAGWVGAAATTRTFTVGGSDAKDGETSELSNRLVYLAEKVYNSGPADITVGMNDTGANYLVSADITVS